MQNVDITYIDSQEIRDYPRLGVALAIDYFSVDYAISVADMRMPSHGDFLENMVDFRRLRSYNS